MQLPELVEKGVQRTVESEGLEFVHVDYKRQGRGLLLRVDIDKQGGVTLDDCELISKQLSTWLDVEDAVPERYELQVSSPGLDRKLYKTSDYERFVGSLVRVRTSRMVGGLHVIIGRLTSFEGERIVLVDPKAKTKKEYEIDLTDVIETRLEPEI